MAQSPQVAINQELSGLSEWLMASGLVTLRWISLVVCELQIARANCLAAWLRVCALMFPMFIFIFLTANWHYNCVVSAIASPSISIFTFTFTSFTFTFTFTFTHIELQET